MNEMNRTDEEKRSWNLYMKALNRKLSLHEGTKEYDLASRYADTLLRQYQLIIKTNLKIAAEAFKF